MRKYFFIILLLTLLLTSCPININIIEFNTFMIAFNPNGGSYVAPIFGVTYGTTLIAPTEPTKTNNSFGGWYKDVYLESAWEFATDKVTTDIILYAKWISNTTYAIVDDGNGGSLNDSGYQIIDSDTLRSISVSSPFTVAIENTSPQVVALLNNNCNPVMLGIPVTQQNNSNRGVGDTISSEIKINPYSTAIALILENPEFRPETILQTQVLISTGHWQNLGCLWQAKPCG